MRRRLSRPRTAAASRGAPRATVRCVDPAVAHGPAAVSEHHPHRPCRRFSIVTLLLATLLSYGVARTMTRPLAAITKAMRDVAATGDLTRKVTLKSRAWDDEDARTLAATFNTLTESIARFQREAAQRERLSSLGRLSTVIAHEIRNPLMIIRASLTTLRRGRSHRRRAPRSRRRYRRRNKATQPRRDRCPRLRAADPVRTGRSRSERDLPRLRRGRVDRRGSRRGRARPRSLGDPPVVTDAERLRTALVNVLTNARHAVHRRVREAAQAPTAGHRLRSSTRRRCVCRPASPADARSSCD